MKSQKYSLLVSLYEHFKFYNAEIHTSPAKKIKKFTKYPIKILFKCKLPKT